MRNFVKQGLREGRPMLGFVVMTPDVAVIQALAAGGATWFLIDTEHSPIGIESISSMIAASIAAGAAPLVRIQSPRSDLFKQVMDCGAYGAIFPMIESKAQAEDTVRVMRYPPLGQRSFGPIHASQQWSMNVYDYVRQANDELINVAMIETQAAVDRLDEILEVDGVDVYLIARGDLTLDLGCPGEMTNPRVQKAVETAERKILAKKGAVLGGALTPGDDGKKMIERGYRFLSLGHDLGALTAVCRARVDAILGPAKG